MLTNTMTGSSGQSSLLSEAGSTCMINDYMLAEVQIVAYQSVKIRNMAILGRPVRS